MATTCAAIPSKRNASAVSYSPYPFRAARSGRPTIHSEIGVEADARHRYRAARLIVSRIIDVLQIERSEESSPEMRGVKSFEDFFGAIRKAAVAEQKARS